MSGQSSTDVLQQTVSSFATRVSEYADGIANRLGQPLSGRNLTQDEAVARWNFSPLGNTQAADAAYHQLVAQGTPPGQALGQVYPMRSMLYAGADTQAAIATAKQVQGWAAAAAGQEVPEPPKESTLPMSLLQQQRAQQPAPPAGMPPMPQQPPPMPVMPPPPVPSAAPQPMPVSQPAPVI